MTAAHPPRLGIRHVALFVADLAAAERFWVELMGYEVEWRPDPDNVYLHGGHDNLALHRHSREPSEGSRTLPRRAPLGEAELRPRDRLDHIGIAVARAEDVDEWARHLAAHGVALTAAPRTHRDGSRSLYFQGPEALLIQIIHHSPMVG